MIVTSSASPLETSKTPSESQTLEAKSLEQFLSAIGCILLNETDKELEIMNKHSTVIVKTQKDIFSQYSFANSSTLNNEEEKVAPEETPRKPGRRKSSQNDIKRSAFRKQVRESKSGSGSGVKIYGIAQMDSLPVTDKTMKDLQNELFSEDDSLFNDTEEEDISPKSSIPKIKAANSELSSIPEEKKVLNLEETKMLNSNDKTQSSNKIQSSFVSLRTFRSPSTSKLINHVDTIKKLTEELRIKNSEIQRLTEIKKQVDEPQSNFSFHLAFMFASPLVRNVNNTLANVMQLDYKTEIHDILKYLGNSSHEITYKIDVATLSNFRSVIADAPFALHFTGHGIQNDKQSLGNAYEIYKNNGNILLLEDSNFMAEYLFEKDLKKLVEICNANREFSYNYEVVFVSSCHSEFAGKIFLASGARHVICIEKSQKVLDKASLRFSKVFYQTLFMKKYSVCDSYKIAKDEIRTVFSTFEAEKFLLFVNTDNSNKKNKHKCFPITQFTQGRLRRIDKVPIFGSVPSKDEIFEGRQQDL